MMCFTYDRQFSINYTDSNIRHNLVSKVKGSIFSNLLVTNGNKYRQLLWQSPGSFTISDVISEWDLRYAQARRAGSGGGGRRDAARSADGVRVTRRRRRRRRAATAHVPHGPRSGTHATRTLSVLNTLVLRVV